MLARDLWYAKLLYAMYLLYRLMIDRYDVRKKEREGERDLSSGLGGLVAGGGVVPPTDLGRGVSWRGPRQVRVTDREG